MDYYTESKLISLNSANGILQNSSYKSNVSFFMPGILKEHDDIIRAEISLVHAQIPVSFYVVNYTNNLFKFKLNTDPIQTVTITPGNYNANTLITEIKAKVAHNNFNIAFNKITGKLTFSHNQPLIIYNDFDYSIGTILGLDKLVYTASVSPYEILCPYPLNLLGIKKLTIMSNELITHNFTSGIMGGSNILAEIPNDAVLWGQISYNNYSNISHLLYNMVLENTFDIYIKDENNNFINFNNADWTLTFNLNILKKSPQNSPIKFNDIIQNQNMENKPIKPNKKLTDTEFLLNI